MIKKKDKKDKKTMPYPFDVSITSDAELYLKFNVLFWSFFLTIYIGYSSSVFYFSRQRLCSFLPLTGEMSEVNKSIIKSFKKFNQSETKQNLSSSFAL